MRLEIGLKICRNQDQARVRELENTFNSIRKSSNVLLGGIDYNFWRNLEIKRRMQQKRVIFESSTELPKNLPQVPSRSQVSVKSKDEGVLTAVEKHFLAIMENFQPFII
jgi:hypothetical protein